MRKLSLLGLCRRLLVSPFAGESAIDHGRLCSASEALYRTLGLSSSSGSVAGFATSFGNRYIHASGLPKHGFLVHHGDQYVRFRVQFPTKINERQHAILEEFAKEEIIHGNSNSNDKDWVKMDFAARNMKHIMPNAAFPLENAYFCKALFTKSTSKKT
ncbi:hypothetical protein ACLB2K_046058 [Fragaria x ananassa]